jgi:hypothetical protein
MVQEQLAGHKEEGEVVEEPGNEEERVDSVGLREDGWMTKRISTKPRIGEDAMRRG